MVTGHTLTCNYYAYLITPCTEGTVTQRNGDHLQFQVVCVDS